MLAPPLPAPRLPQLGSKCLCCWPKSRPLAGDRVEMNGMELSNSAQCVRLGQRASARLGGAARSARATAGRSTPRVVAAVRPAPCVCAAHCRTQHVAEAPSPKCSPAASAFLASVAQIGSCTVPMSKQCLSFSVLTQFVGSLLFRRLSTAMNAPCVSCLSPITKRNALLWLWLMQMRFTAKQLEKMQVYEPRRQSEQAPCMSSAG